MQTLSFQDFDAFAKSVQGVDSTMMMQNLKRHRWNISHVDLPGGIHVQLGKMGSGNIVEGQSWRDGYVLYLPLTDACLCLANGIVIENNAFMVLEPGCEFCYSPKGAHDWCSIFIPASKFTGSGAVAESSSGSDKLICRVTRPQYQLAHQFRALVSQIITAAADSPQFESAPAARSAAAEAEKITALLVGRRLAGGPDPQGRPKLRRQDIIRRAKALLEERDTKPVATRELAASAEVSERTLRTAFNEYFGMGPVRYLQLRQLNQVHRALQAADPEAVSVSEVLVQHGVWEFGRCATRYRRLFGELPSETLRTQKR